jgi:hypothetical protein
MFTFIKSLFAWERKFRRGAFDYYENTVTGKRKAVRWVSGGHAFKDRNWLENKK